MKIAKLYQFIQILSLDVALGSASMAYLCTRVLGKNPDYIGMGVLALSVWLIYTLDHLLDARKIPHSAHTQRHKFHQKYFVPIAGLWLLASLLNLYLIFTQLSAPLILYGSYLGGFIFLHFLISQIEKAQQLFYLQKETRIALFYSLGVLLVPWSQNQFYQPYKAIWLLLSIFLLAWLNLLLISWYEYEKDLKDGHISMVRYLGKYKTQQYTANLSLITMATLVFAGWFFTNSMEMVSSLAILMAMSFTLWQVQNQKEYFQQDERYRTWSDIIFLYPLLLFLVDYYGIGF